MQLAFVQMTLARLIALGATLVGFVVLARLLDPTTFGHFAIAFSAYSLLKVVANFGLRQYIIQAESALEPTTISGAAGLSMLLSLAGCAVCLVPFVFLRGWLVPEPVAAALVPLGLALLFGPLILSVEAQLHRALVFGIPAAASVAASVAEVAVAIAMAAAGFGVVALAMGTLAAQGATALVLLTVGASYRAWPRLRLKGMHAIRSFGGRFTIVDVLPQAADLVLVPALGALAGPAATGLYNRALLVRNLLDRTVLEGVAPVVLPAMSGSLRAGLRPAEILETKLDYLCALCWPAFAMILLLSEPMVSVLLGAQWTGAVPAVQILALGGFAIPFTKMSSNLFIAAGALGVYLRIQIWYQALRVVLGLVGAAISLEAFCVAISAALLGKALMVERAFDARVESAAAAHRRPVRRGLLLTAAALTGPVLIVVVTGLDPLPTLVAATLAAAAGWLAGLWLTGHPLLLQLGLLRSTSGLLQRRSP